MNWITLETASQLEEIKKVSEEKTVLIFKHSTSCSISATALNRLERAWKPEELPELKAYYLDLLSFRDISRQIANQFDIVHQSPQVLLINKGMCVYHASHLGISYPEVKNNALKLQE
ncbi:MAG: bacillithiol system redox-active protein YtxJ [Bacteroidota bacterium]